MLMIHAAQLVAVGVFRCALCWICLEESFCFGCLHHGKRNLKRGDVMGQPIILSSHNIYRISVGSIRIADTARLFIIGLLLGCQTQ